MGDATGGVRRRRWAGAAWHEDVVYRRVVQVLLLANVVAVLVLLVSLRGEQAQERPDVGAATGSGNAVPAGPASGVPSPDPVPGAAADQPALEPSFLQPPEEFLRASDEVAGTGALDLDAVARLDAVDPPTARARFTELGFQGARSRAWQSPDDALLVVAYGFADERGASSYVSEATALRSADPAAAPLPLPGVPGGSAFRLDVPGDPTQVAFLARGATAYVVGLVGPAAADPAAATLQQLAALQYAAAA